MRALILLPLMGLLAGCGGESYQLAPVSGRVTLNKKPLAGAAVTFQPVAGEGGASPGPGSGGFTDADGRYTLKLIGKETNGAVIGKHKVQITLVPPKEDPADDRPKRFKQLPAKYHGRNTTLEWDVKPGGTDAANFPLTTP
jgi:hypothetical protein